MAIAAATLLSATDAWAVNTIVGYEGVPRAESYKHFVTVLPDHDSNPPGIEALAIGCTKQRRVILEKKTGPDSWTEVGRGKTDDDGDAIIKTDKKPGTYRVVAPKRRINSEYRCYREVSEPQHVDHRDT